MRIERVNCYTDPRFSKELLFQHGCFLADGEPCAFEIRSDHEAVIHYRGTGSLTELIDEFRFFACHITTFYDENENVVAEYPPAKVFSAAIRDIQPSQFYVDKEKIAAVSRFIHADSEIIIPVLKYGDRYISLDGHTRLYWAIMNGWDAVRAVEDVGFDSVLAFVKEAQSRGIFTAEDMELVDHSTYQEKWNQFCDAFFAQKDCEGETGNETAM